MVRSSLVTTATGLDQNSNVDDFNWKPKQIVASIVANSSILPREGYLMVGSLGCFEHDNCIHLSVMDGYDKI